MGVILKLVGAPVVGAAPAVRLVVARVAGTAAAGMAAAASAAYECAQRFVEEMRMMVACRASRTERLRRPSRPRL